MKNYLGTKKFYKELFLVCLPLIIQFFFQQSVNFMDNIMVGSINKQAIAAVGIANQYYKLFFPIIFATGAGAMIYTAQYYGANNHQKLKQTFGFKLLYPMAITFLFLIFGYLFKNQIVDFFIEDDSILTRQYALSYLSIMMLSFIPYTITNAFTRTLRPIGRAKVAMYVSSVAMIVNLVLNYVLIYGKFGVPALGVEGAAIATVIARVVEMSIFIILFFKKDYEFKGTINETFKIDKDLQVSIFKKMGPLLINELGFTTANILIFKAFVHTGTDGIAVVSIVDTIFMLFLILMNGLGTATSIFVGNRLGANKLEEANQNAMWMLSYGLIMGSAVMVLVILFSPLLPHLYQVDDYMKDLIMYAIILRAFTILPMAITRIVIFVLRTGGRADQTMIVDAAFMWGVKVPLALVLAYYFNASILVIYGTVHFTQYLNAFISVHYFRKRDWVVNLT